HPLPDGWELLAPTRLAPFLSTRLFSWPGKLRMAFDLGLPRGIADDESLGAFVRRRLGREALERVAQPLVAGIYTADPDDLSLTATMPRFAELEKQERSIILGLRRARRRARETGVSGARWSLFVTLKEGMEDLVAALATRLQPGTVLLKQRVAGVERRGDRWRVATAEGADLDADRVIVATESHAAARMLRYVDPTLAMRARAERREALGITAAPALARVFRWPKAMPQYHVGHLARVETIERRAGALPGLDLAGGAYRGVGIADCVRSGEAAAERAL